jgi:phosphohistidine phosphatase
MKRLYIVRHAKSSWADQALIDRERPLNKRGLRDAPVMGKRLVDRDIRIDAVWSSPARRAEETANHIAKALKYPRKKITICDALYSSTLGDLWQVIRSCSDKVDNLLIVGHNSLISELASFLVNEKSAGDMPLIPTCGVVALEFSCASWSDSREHAGQFLFFDYPKNIEALV